jgi:hypothetical protein
MISVRLPATRQNGIEFARTRGHIDGRWKRFSISDRDNVKPLRTLGHGIDPKDPFNGSCDCADMVI